MQSCTCGASLSHNLNEELAICGSKGANELVFQGLDGSFCGVYPVIVGLNQL
jgi:hypothetical protein